MHTYICCALCNNSGKAWTQVQRNTQETERFKIKITVFTKVHQKQNTNKESKKAKQTKQTAKTDRKRAKSQNVTHSGYFKVQSTTENQKKHYKMENKQHSVLYP